MGVKLSEHEVQTLQQAEQLCHKIDDFVTQSSDEFVIGCDDDLTVTLSPQQQLIAITDQSQCLSAEKTQAIVDAHNTAVRKVASQMQLLAEGNTLDSLQTEFCLSSRSGCIEITLNADFSIANCIDYDTDRPLSNAQCDRIIKAHHDAVMQLRQRATAALLAILDSQQT